MADLQSLIRRLRYRRGALGAERAERVADTVPEVGRQYSMKALEDLLASGDPVSRFDPSKFEEFAAPLTPSQEARADYIPALASINKAIAEARQSPLRDDVGLDSVPELWVYPGGRAIAGRGDPRPAIAAHEGRHRNRVLSRMYPGEKTLVELHPASPWAPQQIPNLDQVFGVRPHGTEREYGEKLEAILDLYKRLDYLWPESQPRLTGPGRGQWVPTYQRSPVRFRQEFEPFAGGGLARKARYAAEEVEELLRRLPRSHKTRSPNMQPIHDEAVQELEKFVLGDSDPLVTVEGGGYKIHVVPLVGDDATEWGPKGRYIVEYGDEMPVPTGRWMDFWDEDLKPYGIKSKRAYDRLDRKERARINAQVQLDKYIGSQFYDSHARFWDPDGYDSFWDKIGQFIPDPQLRNETLRLLSEEPERLPEIEKMFGHIKPLAGGGLARKAHRLFHGGPKELEGRLRSPMFATEDPHGAAFYASEMSDPYGSGVVYELEHSLNKPFDVSDKYGLQELVDFARSIGIPVEEAGDWFRSSAIRKYRPYSEHNPLDLAYIPEFREAMKERGYDSLFAWDEMVGTDIPTWVVLDPLSSTKIKRSWPALEVESDPELEPLVKMWMSRPRYRLDLGDKEHRYKNRPEALEAELEWRRKGFAGGGLVRKLRLLHGSEKGMKPTDELKEPFFMTDDRRGAEWYAHFKRGQEGEVYDVEADIQNPLDLTKNDGAYLDFLDRVENKAKVQFQEKHPYFQVDEIEEVSGYPGHNPNDLFYIPRVRQMLLDEGYDGVKTWDTLENGEIPTWITLKPGQARIVDKEHKPQKKAGGGKVTGIGRRALFGTRKPKAELEVEPVPQLPAVVEEAALPVAQVENELTGLPKLEELVQTPIGRRTAIRGAAALATHGSKLAKLIPEAQEAVPTARAVDWDRVAQAVNRVGDDFDTDDYSRGAYLEDFREMYEPPGDADFPDFDKLRKEITLNTAKEAFGDNPTPAEVKLIDDLLEERYISKEALEAISDEGGDWRNWFSDLYNDGFFSHLDGKLDDDPTLKERFRRALATGEMPEDLESIVLDAQSAGLELADGNYTGVGSHVMDGLHKVLKERGHSDEEIAKILPSLRDEKFRHGDLDWVFDMDSTIDLMDDLKDVQLRAWLGHDGKKHEP